MDDYSSVLQHPLSAFVNGDIKALKIPAKYNLEGTFSESEPDEPHNCLKTYNFVQKVELSHKKLNIDPCTSKIDCPAALVSPGVSLPCELA